MLDWGVEEGMEGKWEMEKLWEKAGCRFCLVFPFLNPCPCPCPLCPVNRLHSSWSF